jgi:glycine dehydrogenase subunit 1
MLRQIGVEPVEALLASIPRELRLERKLDLPPRLSEPELIAHLQGLSAKNLHAGEVTCFLGAGLYHHFIPAALDHLLSRSEFYTTYTPYQPEVSQGTLQAIYEYQTLICQLTGMEVANASMYDGATAVAEAALMAQRITGRKGLVVSSLVHPEYRAVLETYLTCVGADCTEVGYRPDGATDMDELGRKVSQDTACIIVQSPNFFGVIETLEDVASVAQEHGALLIVAVTEPVALGIVKAPGACGADIVAGEGQALGSPLNFGGPLLGLFAVRRAHVRLMPGRLVGETVDRDGRRGYVLALSTREQHIRRGKATSNICTNEGLCALAAAIYLALMGKSGFRRLAMQNLQRAHYAKQSLRDVPGVSLPFSGPTFNEFVVETEEDPARVQARLMEERIVGGLHVGAYYPELERCILFCVTETHSRDDIDRLVRLIRGKRRA